MALWTRAACAAAVLALAATALTGCDNGPSAVRKNAAPAAAGGGGVQGADEADAGRGGPRIDHRKDQVAKADDGKPVWAPSRAKSAEEGAERAFERNGDAFGVRTVDQYVERAHAFVGHPPKGTLTLTRKNGDTMFYDPKDNIFAVANKDGAPRTMFKPDDGMAYWEKQKQLAERSRARGSRSGDDQT